MKIYTTVREDGKSGPKIHAKDFNDAEIKLRLIQSTKDTMKYRVVGEEVNFVSLQLPNHNLY